MEVGCDAIIVAGKYSQDSDDDSFVSLKYTASVKQRGRTLWKAKKPIRVFRSSKLHNKYRPPKLLSSESSGQSLRYDGLYSVAKRWRITKSHDVGNFNESVETFGFLLKRCDNICEYSSEDFLRRCVQLKTIAED